MAEKLSRVFKRSLLLFVALWLSFSPNLLAETLEQRVERLEKLVRILQKKAGIKTPEELAAEQKYDDKGQAQRKDAIQRFPEISTFAAFDLHDDTLINGLGIELFHDRYKERRSKWKLELMLADEFAGLSAGYIMVPVINFNIGPFWGYDLEEHESMYGLKASVFSF